MKIKLVRLDDESRGVLLRSAIIGNRLTLPEQLERSLYVRIAKAIEAAGGKWNKKERCHLFPQAVRETFDIQAGTVEVVNIQQTYQAFDTPPAIAEQVADLADLTAGDRVLEPSAGTGNLVRAVRSRGIFKDHLTAVEIDARKAELLQVSCGKVICGDFLAQNGSLGSFDRVVMNPPFTGGQDAKHIFHAFGMVAVGGKLVAICGGGPRAEKEIRPYVEQTGGEWIELPAGSFAESGTDVRTILLSLNA